MTNVDVHSSADAMDASADADALTIGRRIRQLRTARGMTLDELAAAVERAPSQLSMIETGKREPKLTLLRAIARALGATVDQLLEAETLDERATLEIALAILLEATLSFLGLGVPPPLPSWGLMIAEAKDYMFFSPWVIVIPGVALFVLVLGINLLGDGLRDAFATRSRT